MLRERVPDGGIGSRKSSAADSRHCCLTPSRCWWFTTKRRYNYQVYPPLPLPLTDMSYVACWCYLLCICRRVGSVLRNDAAGTGPIWLDDVQCIGTETHIDQCRHNDWGSNNCGHVEDVYISCADTGMGTVVSLVFNIQNSISISSSSARTFVSTGWRIKINIFVLTHSKTLTLRPSLRTF